MPSTNRTFDGGHHVTNERPCRLPHSYDLIGGKKMVDRLTGGVGKTVEENQAPMLDEFGDPTMATRARRQHHTSCALAACPPTRGNCGRIRQRRRVTNRAAARHSNHRRC